MSIFSQNDCFASKAFPQLTPSQSTDSSHRLMSITWICSLHSCSYAFAQVLPPSGKALPSPRQVWKPSLSSGPNWNPSSSMKLGPSLINLCFWMLVVLIFWTINLQLSFFGGMGIYFSRYSFYPQKEPGWVSQGQEHRHFFVFPVLNTPRFVRHSVMDIIEHLVKSQTSRVFYHSTTTTIPFEKLSK